MQKENKSFVLTGKAYWAHLRKPNEESGKYQMDLSIDDKTKAMLEDLGITVKNAALGIGTKNKIPNDPRGNFVTLKKNHMLEDGTLLPPPAVVDGKKQSLPSETLIGNGSIVNVASSIYDWKFKSKTGKSLNLNAVQVKTLVKYENSGVDVFKEEEGYLVDNEVSSRTLSDTKEEDFSFDD